MSATNNATAAGQHVDHTLDNLIISEHIHLAGQLARRDFDTQYGDSLVSGKTYYIPIYYENGESFFQSSWNVLYYL